MRLRKYIGDRNFYKVLLAVAVPIMLQNSISNFISLLDNVMVGQLGTEQMTGVSIINQLLFVFYLCIFGAVSGAGIFGTQFFGKNGHTGVRHTFRFKLQMTAILLAGAVILFWVCGEQLINLYLHDGSQTGDLALTMYYAKQYLDVALIGLLPYTLTQVYASSLREIGRTVPPMTAGFVGVGVNVFLNYVLIFGKLGFPVLGVKGAAIATVVSRFVECGAVMVWTHFNVKKCEFIRGVYRSMYVPVKLIKQILITGMPLLLNDTVWAIGLAIITQCYSVRGIAVVSAINISNTVLNTFAVVYLSTGTAIAVLLGQRLGAGETEKAKDDARKMVAFAVLLGIAATILIAACAPFFPSLYNTTDEVRGLATAFTLIIAITAPMLAFLNSAYYILRSGGKTVITFFFDCGCLWCVNVVLAFVLSRYTTLPIIPLYLLCQGVDIFKCVIGYALVKRGSWARDLTGVGE